MRKVAAAIVVFFATGLLAQQDHSSGDGAEGERSVYGYDDPFTERVNEGRIGDGFDDPFTEDINEGAVGSGFDDPFTPDVNEGAIGTGFDDPFTPDINEGAIDWE